MLREEYIGKKMEVMESGKEDLVGVRGTVADETKNTLKVETETGMKTIMKKGSKFRIDGKEIDGDDIAVRPEDRVKI